MIVILYIAAFFGLIHGFGFYGVLEEISVDENIIANLFFFNGIEVAIYFYRHFSNVSLGNERSAQIRFI